MLKIRESRIILKQAQAARMRNDGESIKDIAKTLKVDRSFAYRAGFYFKRIIKSNSEVKRRRGRSSQETNLISSFINLSTRKASAMSLFQRSSLVPKDQP